MELELELSSVRFLFFFSKRVTPFLSATISSSDHRFLYLCTSSHFQHVAFFRRPTYVLEEREGGMGLEQQPTCQPKAHASGEHRNLLLCQTAALQSPNLHHDGLEERQRELR